MEKTESKEVKKCDSLDQEDEGHINNPNAIKKVFSDSTVIAFKRSNIQGEEDESSERETQIESDSEKESFNEEIVTKKSIENFEQEDSYRTNVKDIIKKKESIIKNDSIDILITPSKKTNTQPKRLSQDLLSKFGNLLPTNLNSKIDLVSKNNLNQVVEQDIESKDSYSPVKTISLSDFDQNKDDQETGQSNLLHKDQASNENLYVPPKIELSPIEKTIATNFPNVISQKKSKKRNTEHISSAINISFSLNLSI